MTHTRKIIDFLFFFLLLAGNKTGKIVKSNNEKFHVGKRYQYSGEWAEYSVISSPLLEVAVPAPEDLDPGLFLSIASITTVCSSFDSF